MISVLIQKSPEGKDVRGEWPSASDPWLQYVDLWAGVSHVCGLGFPSSTVGGGQCVGGAMTLASDCWGLNLGWALTLTVT